jgi:2-dehydropantoate 2-reductase
MAQSQSWWSGEGTKPESQEPYAVFPEIKEPEKLELPAEDGTENEELLTRRIHILGMGSIGTLVAHSLRTIPNPPPVTLMQHRDAPRDNFRAHGSVLRLVNPSTGVNDTKSGYDLDVLERDSNKTGKPYFWHYWPHWVDDGKRILNERATQETMESGETFIYNLICTVKAQVTAKAMVSIRHRVDSRTTIVLMQNGLGQVDELMSKVFTDPSRRPTFLIAIVSHGCYMDGPNTVVHAGTGVTSLGIHRDQFRHPLPPKTFSTNIADLSPSDRKYYYPTDADLYAPSLSSRYLLRTLTRTPALACAPFANLDLLQLQYEKLSTNALLNALTAIYDVPNGDTLQNPHLSTIQNMLAAEISLILRSLPELASVPGLAARFSAERLKNLYVAVATKTAKNSSSMREDLRHKKDTEIDYINGYIVRRGRELGIQAACNFMVCEMVKAKLHFAVSQARHRVPFDSRLVESSEEIRGGEPVVTLEDVSGIGLGGEPRDR